MQNVNRKVAALNHVIIWPLKALKFADFLRIGIFVQCFS